MEYPNLQSCRVTIQSERTIIQPPVRLPIDIIQQVQQPIPKPIDFTLGMCVWCTIYIQTIAGVSVSYAEAARQ